MVSHSKKGLVELGAGIWAAIMSIIPPEGGGPNAGFIVAGDQVVVIDSLISPGTGQELITQLAQVTDRSPTYLINTHAHGDHVLGNQAVSPPATIIAHENVREVLLSQGEAIVASFAERYSDVAPGIKDTTVMPPHITYSERMTLSFDGRMIELIHPGVAHSNGDTLLYLPEEKILFAGDILFNHIFPPIFGSSAGWIATIERLEKMAIETIVPGHGYIATKKELVDLKECLIALRSQVKDCFDRNLTPEQATNEIDIPYLEWPRSERLGQDVRVIYEELEREVSG